LGATADPEPSTPALSSRCVSQQLITKALEGSFCRLLHTLLPPTNELSDSALDQRKAVHSQVEPPSAQCVPALTDECASKLCQ
jgi:hypothetical protein